ncbi:MAG: SMP-30/gluconolactonase/LRE family protein [Mycobacterium sp.]
MRLLMEGFGLLEAARWYPDRGLLFSDMICGGVYCCGDMNSPAELIIAHRKGIGGLVAHRDGGLVVAGRNVARKGADGATSVILETAQDETFFNDLTADLRGRLIVGSVGTGPSPHEGAREAQRQPGRLYRVDVDGSVTTLADDVLVSNGLGVSPSGDVLYHVDSYRRTVWAFDESGNRRVFADVSGHEGIPDGLAVAADGSVYVAMAGGGVVLGWAADGTATAELRVPQPLVTSICFGGADLGSLFVLTGVNEEYADDQGGSVYVTAAPSPGLAAPVCSV